MNITIQELYDAGIDMDSLNELFIDNKKLRTIISNSVDFEDFETWIGSTVYYLLKDYQCCTQEILLAILIQVYLGYTFTNLPNTCIAGDVWEELEDPYPQQICIKEVVNTHKNSINEPEKFFLKVFSSLILSEELARIVTLDEDKLKEESYFKKTMSSYYPLKEVSSLLYEEVLKLYQSKKA